MVSPLQPQNPLVYSMKQAGEGLGVRFKPTIKCKFHHYRFFLSNNNFPAKPALYYLAAQQRSKMDTLKFTGIMAIIGVVFIRAIACTAALADVSNPDLEGSAWVLKSYGDPVALTAAVPDKEVTLTFDKENNAVTGNGGVNGYGGTYELNGHRITISNLMQTMMAGPEPLQGQEIKYFNILQSAKSYKIEGQSLTITGTEGVLVFLKK
jgi:heat shock protein HslJ